MVSNIGIAFGEVARYTEIGIGNLIDFHRFFDHFTVLHILLRVIFSALGIHPKDIMILVKLSFIKKRNEPSLRFLFGAGYPELVEYR